MGSGEGRGREVGIGEHNKERKGRRAMYTNACPKKRNKEKEEKVSKKVIKKRKIRHRGVVRCSIPRRITKEVESRKEDDEECNNKADKRRMGSIRHCTTARRTRPTYKKEPNLGKHFP